MKITVESINLRRYESGKYEMEKNNFSDMDLCLTDKEKKPYRTLCRILNLKAIPNPERIMYPCHCDGGDIFEWFAKNRSTLRDTGLIGSEQQLPSPEIDMQGLKQR